MLSRFLVMAYLAYPEAVAAGDGRRNISKLLPKYMKQHAKRVTTLRTSDHLNSFIVME
jgi:hypothetical protein